MGRHPTSLSVKGATFWKAFLPLTMAGLGVVVDGWGGTAPTHSWGGESCTKPHLTRYFSGEYIHLSPIFFICDFTDKDTNIFELWAVVHWRQTVLYLCVLCGPDSSGQCDLFGGVIFWTSGRWQLKNEPLKTLCSQAGSVWLTNHTENDFAGLYSGHCELTESTLVLWFMQINTRNNFLCTARLHHTGCMYQRASDASTESPWSVWKKVCAVFLGSCLSWDQKLWC